jgi:hypothetical protein
VSVFIPCLRVAYSVMLRRVVLVRTDVSEEISTSFIRVTRIGELAFTSVCFCRLFPHIPYTYTVALDKLGLQFLRKRRYYTDALFLFHIYRGLKSYTSILENVSLRVPPSNLEEFALFCACPSNTHCHSARCAYAVNVVGKFLDIFALGAVHLNLFIFLVIDRIELIFTAFPAFNPMQNR